MHEGSRYALTHYIIQIRKSKDYVYGIRVYKALGIWKGYYRVKKSLSYNIINVHNDKQIYNSCPAYGKHSWS